MANKFLTIPASPVMPIATDAYDPKFENQRNSIFRTYFNQVSGALGSIAGRNGGEFVQVPYGVFKCTSTQSPAVINTAYAVPFDTTVYTNSIAIVSSSQVKVSTTGYYLFTIAAQFDKISAAVMNGFVWISKNGTNITNSALKCQLVGGSTSEMVGSNAWLVSMTSGDYIQIMWGADNVDMRLEAIAASAPYPAIPAVSLNAELVSIV